MKEESSLVHKDNLEEIRLMPLLQLKERADAGNSIASLIFGEKILESRNNEEFNKGAVTIIEALNSMENEFLNGDISKEFFLESIVEGSDAILNNYISTDEYIADEVFKFCQNAYELDNTKTRGLGICYERGIGCEPDAEKANYFKEKSAENGGFLDKVPVFLNYKDNRKVNAVIWAQKALASEDADNYPKLNARIKMWLAENGESDDKGEYTNLEQAEKIFEASSVTDSREALCLIDLAKSDEEKLEYARTGATHNVELKAIYEGINEKIRIEQERTEQERQNKERQEKKKKFIISLVAIASVLLIIVIAASSIISAKKEKERKMLVEKAKKSNEEVLGDWFSMNTYKSVNSSNPAISLSISENGDCIAKKDEEEGTFEYDNEQNTLTLKIGQYNKTLEFDGNYMYENMNTSDECIYSKDFGKLKQLVTERVEAKAQELVIGTYNWYLLNDKNKPTRWLYINSDKTYRHYDSYNEEDTSGTWSMRIDYDENNIEKITLDLVESGSGKTREFFITKDKLLELEKGGYLTFINGFSVDVMYYKQ